MNTTRQEYTVNRPDGSARGCNVLGILDGTLEPNYWLVVGGHYDANIYATSGAYDNAVGVGTVLELATVYKEYFETSPGPNITIIFACCYAEEGGGAGSAYFLNNLPEDVRIVAYLNFDMYSLNYPVRNRIPGSQEEYYKLNLYTSPVTDFSGYSDIDYNESTKQNFSNFQELLTNITYDKYNYPPEWVPVMDDSALVSDHRHFVRASIPAVWFRGMNEYPRDQGDLNERNFKHTPVDTLETMERYAGGKSELLKGIGTGLTIGYELIKAVLDWYDSSQINYVVPDCPDPKEDEDSLQNFIWIIAAVCISIVILGIIYYIYRNDSKKRTGGIS